MAIVHQVGKAVDDCEKSAIQHLRSALPDTFHVYHNLELIPQRGGHPYEYDLIVIGRSSAWVVEVKGYRGNISGNANQWKLANGKFERSPIHLINKKEKIYIDALVVLCDEESKLELSDDPQFGRILKLSESSGYMLRAENYRFENNNRINVGSAICKMLDKRFRPLTRTQAVGEYELEDGIVDDSDVSVTYPARHRLLKTQGRISLKVYRLNTSLNHQQMEKQKAAFIHEAEALTHLRQHANIVQCYSPFLWDADKIVVPMEWVDGPTLRELLDEKVGWDLETRLIIFRQIVDGLKYAHEHMILHRALSPTSIVVLKDKRIKIVNFKGAKIMETSLTVSTGNFPFLETPYMAPELNRDPIASFHNATISTDIYSAGVLMFELITGKRPFTGQSLLWDDELRQASSSLDSIGNPSGIRKIFLKMCAYQSEERFSSFGEVLDQLTLVA